MAKYADRIKYRSREFAQKMRENFKLNDQGIVSTLDRITTSCGNFSRMEPGVNSFSIVSKGSPKSSGNFSAGPGVSQSAGVTGVDVVDLTMISTYSSLIPAVAIDRGMSKPKDIISYMTLVATNKAGGAKAGDTVVNPFAPISPNYDFSTSGAALEVKGDGSSTTLTVGAPIMRGKISIAHLNGGSVDALGQDLNKDGVIYWSGDTASAIKVKSVDYATGSIEFETAPSTDYTITAYADTTSETDSTNTLRLRRQHTDITIEAEPNRLMFEESVEDLARMNRQVLGANFGKATVKMVLNAFTYTLNNGMMRVITEMGKKVFNNRVFDMSAYTVANSFAPTKNDKLNEFMINLNQDLLAKSMLNATFIVVGYKGASILANNADRFKPVPDATRVIDGLIGMYGEYPVYRSQYVGLQELTDTNNAWIIMGARDAAGAFGPAMYGEYIPIFATQRGINWNNPAEYSQLIFNQSKSAPIVDNLIVMGKIKMA